MTPPSVDRRHCPLVAVDIETGQAFACSFDRPHGGPHDWWRAATTPNPKDNDR